MKIDLRGLVAGGRVDWRLFAASVAVGWGISQFVGGIQTRQVRVDALDRLIEDSETRWARTRQQWDEAGAVAQGLRAEIAALEARKRELTELVGASAAAPEPVATD